jgi:hypothetical protein
MAVHGRTLLAFGGRRQRRSSPRPAGRRGCGRRRGGGSSPRLATSAEVHPGSSKLGRRRSRNSCDAQAPASTGWTGHAHARVGKAPDSGRPLRQGLPDRKGSTRSGRRRRALARTSWKASNVGAALGTNGLRLRPGVRRVGSRAPRGRWRSLGRQVADHRAARSGRGAMSRSSSRRRTSGPEFVAEDAKRSPPPRQAPIRISVWEKEAGPDPGSVGRIAPARPRSAGARVAAVDAAALLDWREASRPPRPVARGSLRHEDVTRSRSSARADPLALPDKALRRTGNLRPEGRPAGPRERALWALRNLKWKDLVGAGWDPAATASTRRHDGHARGKDGQPIAALAVGKQRPAHVRPDSGTAAHAIDSKALGDLPTT